MLNLAQAPASMLASLHKGGSKGLDPLLSPLFFVLQEQGREVIILRDFLREERSKEETIEIK